MWKYSFFLILLASLSYAEDTIRPNEVLRQNDSLISANNIFELGFFTDPISGNVFLGIRFKNLPNTRPVWVANRDNPLEQSYAAFQIRDDGNLVVMDRKQAPVIINYATLATSHNTSATLLDDGNLILQQENAIIWQSFDFPTDTLLPGMRLGWFGLLMAQPHRQFLLSWLSPQNPSRGAFTVGTGYKDARTISVWRGGISHVDVGFLDRDSGFFRFIFRKPFDSITFTYNASINETFVTLNTVGRYDMSWLVVAPTGELDEYALYRGRLSVFRHDLCREISGNGSVCLKDDVEKCEDGDEFVAVDGVVRFSSSLNVAVIDDFDDCKSSCKSNCSCWAFALGESGCQLYYGGGAGLPRLSGRSVFHVRSNAGSRKQGRKRWMLAIIILASSIPLIVFAIVVFRHLKRRNKRVFAVKPKTATSVDLWRRNNIDFIGEDNNLRWFPITALQTATDDFDQKNKLGEGGFGPVYKGKLQSGEEIAVKRPSKRSVQGVKEFRNEATLISRLQHRNLVKLLGCSIHGEEEEEEEEYILVYEYLINGSLDSFIFDESKQMLLDWPTRVRIIDGIAQGILYLHKYSRLRIIHRDLKASNILLDGDMNPKISDFGMAKIYGENEARVKTTKIAGTYGYMSPEYAMDGHFSEKSDVFSFGIIVLEIISGKRNIAFFQADHSLNLLGYAWKMWKEERSMEFLDANVANSCTAIEAAKYVQLGLLCVQERAADRPAMPDFAAMLSARLHSLPLPKEPAFLT